LKDPERRLERPVVPSWCDRPDDQRVERMVYGFQPEPLFDLVADVERYPEFLKWWIAARIFRRNADAYFTEQILGLGPIQFNFVSKTILYRPERIVVTADEPSFRRFELAWFFEPIPDIGCRVSVEAGVRLRASLLQRVVDRVLPPALADIVASIEARARKLARAGASR
jgi:coenzyme Q-binding protein COQ10